MDPKFQTSFIPKKSLVQHSGVKPPRTTSFFTLITVIIFATVVLLAGGAWGYEQYLYKNNTKLKDDLNTSLKQFEPSLVAELSRLDSRIEAAKDLLNQHIALTSFFDFLSTVTLRSVRFSSFKYGITSQKVTVAMNGQAESFSAVALQASEFLKPENANFIKNPLFSNLNLDSSGNVLFDFTGVVDPSKISYKSTLSSIDVSTVAPVPVVSTTTQQ